MRVPALALRYCPLAIGLAALVGGALVLSPGHGSAHEGGYLDFTGPASGYLEVPDNPALNPTGAITVEAWIYLNSYEGWGTNPDFTTDPECPMLVGKNWQNSYALALGCGGDVMDSFINGFEQFSDAPTIALNTWTHVAMTYDGSVRTNYQDGTGVKQVSDPRGPIGDTADPLRIGSDVKWDLSLNGRIDDVRIWNVVRTQQQIVETMDYVDPATPGLVADWTFDDGSIIDESCGFTGTLVGDVQVAPDGTSPRPTVTPAPKCLGQPTPSPTPLEGAPSPGDVNCDGRVDLPDGSFLLADLGGVRPTPSARPCNDGNALVDGRPARDDANCDGLVNVRDVLTIFKYVAGLIELLIPCSPPLPT